MGSGSPPRSQPSASQVAWASIAVNVGLTALNLTIAVASGSLAVTAEMVHNLVDLVASIAVLAGVKISERKSRAFPYGLYKVENVVSVGVAILVFFTASEIAQRAVLGVGGPTTVNGWILAGVALSALLPLAFSLLQMRAGRALNSPSLMAAAREYRIHVLSSGVVFLALVGRLVGFPLDRYAALVIVVVIARTGWGLLVDGMRVLLDASLDADTLGRVRSIILADPAVTEVRSLVGRNAGRYRFLEADVALRVDDLARAHAASQRLEGAIRAQIPHVERVLVHYEPQSRARQRLAVPLAGANGTISEHLGEAPYFGFVTIRTADGRVERQEVLPNPYKDLEKAKGLRVAEWLVGLKADVVLTREDVAGKGPAYVFGDAGIAVRLTQATTLADAVAEEGRAPVRGEPK